jgi:hypothetical protein
MPDQETLSRMSLFLNRQVLDVSTVNYGCFFDKSLSAIFSAALSITMYALSAKVGNLAGFMRLITATVTALKHA